MSNIIVEIPNVPGESTLDGYLDQIACTAMQHGIDMPVVAKSTARTEGVSIHGSVTLYHEIDKATPLLRLKAAQSADLGTVVIRRFRTADGVTSPAEIITLGGAQVVAVYLDTPLSDNSSEAAGNENTPADMPVEVFTLDYTQIKWEYKYKPAGGTESTISGSYSTTSRSSVVSI